MSASADVVVAVVAVQEMRVVETTAHEFLQGRSLVQQYVAAVALTSDNDTEEEPISPDMLSTGVRPYVEDLDITEVIAPDCPLYRRWGVYLLRENSVQNNRIYRYFCGYGIRLKRLGTFLLVRT